ncbi:uncharacterized protein [Miscanthus floridulus]|uniref:uncharacterized protein n=1 Tax=Miscanthus floridulus TaxID=154761 RepID=UPI00345B272D
MDITQYTEHLKQLADGLRDVGQPVREISQVLNMLHGLSSKYSHAIPAITVQQPPHTFFSVHLYLLLEEKYDCEHAKTAAQHALIASGGSKPSSGGDGSSTTPPPTQSPAAGTSGLASCTDGSALCTDGSFRGGRGRVRGRGRGYGFNQLDGGSYNQARGSPAWPPSVNPYTGMVQAWQMPFRAPSAGVFDPRPGTPPHQA